jgi:hypothetical protein
VSINIRQKGAEGEREVIRMLTPIVKEVMVGMAFPPDKIEAAEKMIQRNQNQSAVGGCDLNNVFDMAIEVKRQEQLAVGSWWEQCVKSAARNNELPVLIYRQNRKPWKIRTFAFLHVPGKDGGWGSHQIVAEFDEKTFKAWFREWVTNKLLNGYEVRV